MARWLEGRWLLVAACIRGVLACKPARVIDASGAGRSVSDEKVYASGRSSAVKPTALSVNVLPKVAFGGCTVRKPQQGGRLVCTWRAAVAVAPLAWSVALKRKVKVAPPGRLCGAMLRVG